VEHLEGAPKVVYAFDDPAWVLESIEYCLGLDARP
jgi:hypothetical protein